ncbi:MAG: tRNA pseudouridine(38-40) synthase TruA [Bacteroidales bacterium]|nr:tRNA pseudouridine(38-40) synthase TruA [Bacteroidales bacterium]
MQGVKRRYFMFLSFSGAAYHGWQLQPQAPTVQKVLENAMSTIAGEKITVTGAGRTDTGVHASFFCAHFDSDTYHTKDPDKFLHRLNRYLPSDIAIRRIAEVVPDAHARFSALSRTYRYYVTRLKDPFSTDRAWYVPGSVDYETMNEACAILMKHDDFTSFSKLHSGTRTNICRIDHAGWEEDSNRLVLTIKADRFLRNMVRSITGTMIDIGKGKLTIKQFEEIIMAKDRCRAGLSAPARGLFLEDIEYPDELFLH